MMRQAIPLLVLFSNLIIIYGMTGTKHYIVYMGDHTLPTKDVVISANHDMLTSIMGSELQAIEATTHHYCQSFRGFAAMLTPEQANLLEEGAEVISVFESKTYELQTTHSWDFLGVPMHGSLRTAVHLGSDVIVGSIDTGIWPESESFNDKGLGPVPKRFKGECVEGQNFTKANCNRYPGIITGVGLAYQFGYCGNSFMYPKDASPPKYEIHSQRTFEVLLSAGHE